MTQPYLCRCCVGVFLHDWMRFSADDDDGGRGVGEREHESYIHLPHDDEDHEVQDGEAVQAPRFRGTVRRLGDFGLAG